MEVGMIRLLNMSFAAGCTTGIVLILRLLLKRMPKSYAYALWMVVLFRFLCPVNISSPLSLFPVNPRPVRQEILYQEIPEIETGVIWVDRAVNQVMEESLSVENTAASINPIQAWLAVGFVIWAFGMVSFAGYHLWQWWKLQRKLRTAVHTEELSFVQMNFRKGRLAVWESDRIEGAFVMGIFRPAVYLPAGLSGDDREYILCHEQIHAERRDYLVKLLGLAMVAVHWFNPLAWLTFRLMCADMEMSCDERVIKRLGREVRESYSQVLLAQAERRSGILLPLAFGKNHTYLRIRNILKYHKPGVILTLSGVILLVAAGIGLITSPPENVDKKEDENTSVSIIGGADGPTSIFLAGKLGEEEREKVWQQGKPESQWLASIMLGKGAHTETVSGQSENPPQKEFEVFIDFASENSLIFHGEFGLFSFSKEEDGRWKQQMFIKDTDTGFRLAEALETVLPKEELTRDQIHLEDTFLMAVSDKESEEQQELSIREFDAVKMEDGRIAVLGTASSAGGKGRLIDLFYGYYDPKQQIMTQTFLFFGGGQELVNQKGEISEERWLFEKGDYDYYLRTPRELLPFEKTEYYERNLYHIPYGRVEMVRSHDRTVEVIDKLVYLGGENYQKFVLTEERIIFWGFTEASALSVKRPWLISIRLDGSDRQIGDLYYAVAEGVCYDDGYIYYEGWTNDGEFPRPIMRVRPDFTEQIKLGDLPGSLLTVRDGGVCLWMDWEQKRIMAVDIRNIENSEKYWEYLSSGEQGRSQICTMKKMGDGTLRIELTSLEDPNEKEVFQVFIPAGMYEEDFEN